VNDLARTILALQNRGASIVYGEATAMNTVALEGAATAVELPALTPVASGDYCAVLQQGADRLILGPVDGDTPELGSNSNGNWARFRSGFQVCWFLGDRSLAINTAYGSLYQGTLSFTFPQAFSVPPAVSAGPAKYDTGRSWAQVHEPSETAVVIGYVDVASRSAATTAVGYTAVGLWTP
jgi:hypothetical protein